MPHATLTPRQRRDLQGGRWFASIRPALQEALCGSALVHVCRGEEAVFRRGDEHDGLYAVLEGAVRFSTIGVDGRESVFGLAEPPQWFGEVALLDGGPRTHDAVAEREAVLAHVPLPSLLDWLAAHPADWRWLGCLAVHKLRVAFAALEDQGLRPPRARLIRCLVRLAGAYGQRLGTPPRTLHVSQERLGSILSLSRQSVNALLKDLERDGLLTCRRGGLSLLDVDRLRELEATSG